MVSCGGREVGGVVRVYNLHKRNVRVDCPTPVGCHTVIFSCIRIHGRLDSQSAVGFAVQADIVFVPLQDALLIGRTLDTNTEGEFLPVHDLLGLRLNGYVRLGCIKETELCLA